jgi:hypothetical protein
MTIELSARRPYLSTSRPTSVSRSRPASVPTSISTLGAHRMRGTCTADGWTVAWVQSHPGAVRVTGVADGLVVVVGDDVTSDLLSTTLMLAPGGGATVRAAASPPGLLVAPAHVRTVPGTPGVDDVVTIADGDRLLVLSADALDGLPDARPQQHRPWAEEVAQHEPEELLDHLFRDLARGSGAVVVHSGKSEL